MSTDSAPPLDTISEASGIGNKLYTIDEDGLEVLVAFDFSSYGKKISEKVARS